MENYFEQTFALYSPDANVYSDNYLNLNSASGLMTDISNIRFKIKKSGWKLDVATVDSETNISHTHPFFELHHVSDGSFIINIEDNLIELCSNDTLLIFPNVFHQNISCIPNTIKLSDAVQISKTTFLGKPDYFSIFQAHIQKSPGYFLLKNNTKITNYFNQIREYRNLNTLMFDECITSLMHLVFAEILFSECDELISNEYNPHSTTEMQLRTQTIEYFIFRNYMQNITLSSIAKTLKLSEKQISRIFIKTYGVTFRTYITNIRLQNAKKLIKETSMDLSVIATTVGFRSYVGFYKAFREKYGINPSDYLKEKRVNKSDT